MTRANARVDGLVEYKNSCHGWVISLRSHKARSKLMSMIFELIT